MHAMRLCFMLSPLVGFQVLSASYFQAIRKPREALFLMLAREVLILFPLLWILPRYLGLDGIWIAWPCTDLVSSLVTGACLFFELRHLDSRQQEAAAAKEPAPATEDLPVPEDVV